MKLDSNKIVIQKTHLNSIIVWVINRCDIYFGFCKSANIKFYIHIVDKSSSYMSCVLDQSYKVQCSKSLSNRFIVKTVVIKISKNYTDFFLKGPYILHPLKISELEGCFYDRQVYWILDSLILIPGKHKVPHCNKGNQHIQKYYHQIKEGHFDICLGYHSLRWIYLVNNKISHQGHYQGLNVFL